VSTSSRLAIFLFAALALSALTTLLAALSGLLLLLAWLLLTATLLLARLVLAALLLPGFCWFGLFMTSPISVFGFSPQWQSS